MKASDAIVDRLIPGEAERFLLPADALPALRSVLEAVLRSPRAVEELREILRLSVALEQSLESPTASRVLLDLLKSDPEAVHLIGTRLTKKGVIDDTRRFMRREGRYDGPAAPRYGEDPEPGTMRLSSMLDPAGDIRIASVRKRPGSSS
jgi:hypothetical protein